MAAAAARLSPLYLLEEARGWNARVLGLPHPHFLQSYQWGEIKRAHGWRPQRLVWEGGAAGVLLRQRGPFRVAYAPRGPLADWDDPQAWEEALERLETLGRGSGALFLKIDPDLPAGHPAEDALRRRRWRPSAEQVQFRNTLLVDLAPAEEELLAGMKPKTRYNLRLAMRRGVEVRSGEGEDLRVFYRMYRETAARQGFPIRPWEYYRTVWQTFLEAGMAALFVAWREGQPLAGLFAVAFGPRSYYFHGASREEGREHMPSHLLQWEAMRWSRARGCAVYDLWGAPDELSERDPMWGVYRFKEGFGGRLFRGTGAWDLALRPAAAWLYRQVVPRLLALSRRRQLLEAGGGGRPALRRARAASAACGPPGPLPQPCREPVL